MVLKMKSKSVLRVFTIFIFFFVSINSYAQSSSNEQLFVGAWINQMEGSTMIFNSDGTGTIGNVTNFKWAIVGNILAIARSNAGTSIYEYYFTSDNKTLILVLFDHSTGVLYRKRT
jgi:hypothetical protein